MSDRTKSYDELVEEWAELGFERAADNKWTHCAHPERCTGTDSGGNCRLMRDVDWDDRTCWFNSDLRQQTAEGMADGDIHARDALAIAKAENLCSNCWYPLDGHGDLCHAGWWEADTDTDEVEQ